MSLTIPEFYYLFDITDICLRFCGLSEIHKSTKKRSRFYQMFNHLVFAWGIFNILYAVLAETVGCAMFIRAGVTMDDFLVISDILGCNCCSWMSFFKCLGLGWLRKSVVTLVDDLKALYEKETTESEKEIINNAIKPAGKLITIYHLTTNTVAMLYNTFPLLLFLLTLALSGKTDIDVPYPFYYPFNYKMNTFVFTLTYITQMHAGSYTGFGVVLFDSFFCSVLTHLSMHFDLLCHRIKNIKAESDELTPSELRELNHQKVKNIVTDHTTLLKLCDLTNHVFGVPLLFNLTTSSALICTLVFTASICPMAYLVKYIMFLISNLIQLFMISYYGNKLKDASGMISYVTYECNWLDMDRQTRSSLFIMSIKGAKAESISAMGFTEVSMLTFASILKVSMSYFTLLKTIYEKTFGTDA